MTEKLILAVRRPSESAAVIDINGEVDATADQALVAAYEEASADGVVSVILNFTGLEYMNSSGIGLLVTMLIRANRNKQRLCAYGLTDHYREIFQLTRIDEAIVVYGSEAEALSAG
ncbi:MAG: STAS domain-containing protein [Acidimicrobiia bacterium]